MTHLFNARISWADTDLLLGWRNLPEFEYWHNEENDHPVTGKFNSFGWRDKEWLKEKPHNTFRIALLGDSYLEALQVELDRTFFAQTEQALNNTHDLNFELMNFGRSGFSQTEELIVLKNDVIQFSPDMVILFFLPGNDIQDISRETASVLLRPFYTMNESGELILDTSFADDFIFKVKSFISPLKNRSALISFLSERYNSYKQQKRNKAIQTKKIQSFQKKIVGSNSLATANPDSVYLKNYKLNKLLIKTMADYCKKQGIRFMLVTTNTRAYLPEVETELKSIDPTFNPLFFEEDLMHYSKSINIEYLGLQSVFRKYYESNHTVLHWSHWNYEGHRIVANALTKKLEASIYPLNDR